MQNQSRLSWPKCRTSSSKSLPAIYSDHHVSFSVNTKFLIYRFRKKKKTCGFERYRGAANEAIGLWGYHNEKGSFGTATSSVLGFPIPCHVLVSASATTASNGGSRFSGSFSSSGSGQACQIRTPSFEIPHARNLLPMSCPGRATFCQGKYV